MKRLFLLLILVSIASFAFAQRGGESMISGRVVSKENKEMVGFASVYLKGTNYGTTTDENGLYRLKVPAGDYTLVVSAIGYDPVERKITLEKGKRHKLTVDLTGGTTHLDEVEVVSTGVQRVKQSAFNAVAVDTKDLQNSTKNLSEALAKAPGMKIRESGGVGSDMQIMMDGFTGKHVKVFIDGVPQEGVGSSFSLNNIPVNFADRIEIYKGVVPVSFGTDAIGGVINVVTNKNRRRWFLDASYSYGSFNTHKSYVDFGQTLKNGFTYEINAFQNYSDNDYHVDAPVEDFATGRIDRANPKHVKRFNDTYHNEAVVGKLGVVNKSWADRLLFGIQYSHMYKDIQTGVRQDIVYGQKHRHGYTIMPSLEYNKKHLFVRGLELGLTANYNRNITTNVDTSSYKYNWYGERAKLSSPGEQSYLHSRQNNDNWNANLNLNYRLGKAHTFTFSNMFVAFNRSMESLLATVKEKDAINRETRKDVAGLSYRYMPSEKWNVSVFGKYYNLYVAGPIASDVNSSEFVRTSRSLDSWGYGAAGTYFVIPDLQAKLSYEKAYRLPTIEEMFGDEDLETGDIGIKPENSHNINVNLSYGHTFGKHSIYVEGGFIYRSTEDYIQRNITSLSGGKYGVAYVNYGKVKTTGFNFSARYNFSRWLSIGGNLTQMNVRDNMKTMIGSTTVKNLSYKERIPNLPYLFADSDASFYWNNLGGKGNKLTVTYDNQYLHSFSYYSSNIGSNKDEYMVPNQLSHNISVSYSLQRGRDNLALECRNFTNEDLYDNFRLQKAGRAFYAKVRVSLGGR